MNFEEDEMEIQLPVARHEFGHYAVARSFGFATTDVVLAGKARQVGPAGTAGLKLLQPLRSTPEVVGYCESRIKILFAGVLAEALEGGVIDIDRAILYAETTGSHDHAKVRELLQIIRCISHPETTDDDTANAELKSLSDRLWSEAGKIVQDLSVFIECMARELLKRQVTAFKDTIFTEAELSVHPLVMRTFSPLQSNIASS